MKHKLFFRFFLLIVSLSIEMNSVIAQSLIINPTDVYEEISSDSFSVYPNPAVYFIYFQNIAEDISYASIYRIDGSLLLQSTVSNNNNCIDISNLKSGLYILKINTHALKFINL